MEFRRQQGREQRCDEQQRRRQCQSRENGQVAGGEGPLGLARVGAIGFQVEQVVQHVHRGGAQAEGHQRQQGCPEQRQVGRLVSRQDRNQDQGVLGPLVRAQCPQRRPQRVAPVRKSRLVGAGERGAGITGQYPIEKIQMLGHAPRQLLVGGAIQPEAAARAALGFEPAHERLVVGERSRVERHPRCDLGLQAFPTAQQPQGQAQQDEGIALDQ